MKKLLISLLLMTVATNMIYSRNFCCTPTGGGSMGQGADFNDPITIPDLQVLLQSTLFTQPEIVNIYLAKGDYYDELKLTASTVDSTNRANIIAINVYGSYRGVEQKEDPQFRDFETGRTYLHAGASGNCPIWIDINGTYGNTCIVDGIWIDSYDGNDYQTIHDYAMRLVGGSYVISHCTIQHFETTASLMFLEGGNEIFRIVNSVIVENESEHLLDAYCDLQIINSTIAKLILGNQLIGNTLTMNNYRIDNSIIYACSNYANYWSTPFDVRNSIIETYDYTWIVDNGNNYWNTDPMFTGYSTAPYSCISSSVASNNGNPGNLLSIFTTLSPNRLFFDASNNPRFYDMFYSYIDIGAYQHYSGGNYYYQNYYNPNPMMAPRQNSESVGNGQKVLQ